MATYLGFSTDNDEELSVKLTDVDLVNQDLLNHFSIRPGEIRGRPTFGSTLQDMISRYDDDVTRAAIYEEVLRIVTFDPRCRLQAFQMFRIDRGVRFKIRLRYLELGLSGFFEFAMHEEV